MLSKIFEDDITDSPELTDTQKKVLVMVKAAATPKVAFEDVSKDPNDIAARDMLHKMNLIDMAGNAISINDAGMQALRDEGLMDDNNELFPEVKKKYLNGKEDKGKKQELGGGPIGGEPIDTQGNTADMGQPPSSSGTPGIPPVGESYSLMKEINHNIRRR
jgi:hypothetical protein